MSDQPTAILFVLDLVPILRMSYRIGTYARSLLITVSDTGGSHMYPHWSLLQESNPHHLITKQTHFRCAK